MSKPDGPNTHKVSPPPPPSPAALDLESGDGDAAVSNIVQRWNRENLLKKCSLASRILGFIFSFLAFIIMSSNKHGDWREFEKYIEYRYLADISICSALYTGFQSLWQIHEHITGREMFSRLTFDFCGDQIAAYLLISSVSSAVPLTNRMRIGANDVFTSASASAIGMEFFAFFAMAVSSLVSGYRLSNGSYI